MKNSPMFIIFDGHFGKWCACAFTFAYLICPSNAATEMMQFIHVDQFVNNGSVQQGKQTF